MPKKRLYFPIAAFIIAALACNLPGNSQQASGPNAAFTAAAQTVEAKLTGITQPRATDTLTPTSALTPGPVSTTQAALTSTVTHAAPPSVTITPTSTQVCDRAQFVLDVTVADDTIFGANETFTKTWRLKNTGTCSWTPSYTFAFSSGDSMSGPSSIGLSGNVNSGDTVDISVNLKAPASAGTYTGNWRLRNAAGVEVVKVYVRIKVGSGGDGGGPFAVIHVNYSTTTWNSPGFVNCPQVNAEIVTNAAGTVQYHWVRDDGDSTSGTLTFSAAGSQTVNAQWSLGSAWAGSGSWMGIYIDSPNHQDFGHVTITPCTSP